MDILIIKSIFFCSDTARGWCILNLLHRLSLTCTFNRTAEKTKQDLVIREFHYLTNDVLEAVLFNSRYKVIPFVTYYLSQQLRTLICRLYGNVTV